MVLVVKNFLSQLSTKIVKTKDQLTLRTVTVDNITNDTIHSVAKLSYVCSDASF